MMKELIEQTEFADKAEELAELMSKSGIKEINIPNLPNYMGMKVLGISTYKLQSQLMNVIKNKDAHIDVKEEKVHVFDELFGVRISSALQEAGFNIIDDLSGKDVSDLSQLNGIGRTSAEKIISVVEQGASNG